MSSLKGILTGVEEKLVRQLHMREWVRIRTGVPFQIDPVIHVRKIGFADIPAIIQHFSAKQETMREVIPELRSCVFAYLHRHQICDEAVAFAPTIGLQRTCVFVDENPDSSTCGKRKRGIRYRCWFEIRQGWVDQFAWDWRQGSPRLADEV